MSAAASPSPKAFAWPLRVYWEDTDAGGIVFYANYLKFFERSRTEWLRSLGLGQQALWDSEGGFFVVAEASLRYLHSARLDDGLTITTEPTAIGRAAITVRQQAWRNPCEPGQAPLLLCDGTVRAAWVSGPQRKPGRIPSTVLNLL